MRLHTWRPVALVSLALALFGGEMAAAQTGVTLAWDPSPGGDIAGYRLYIGPTTRTYTNAVDVGNTNVATASNLVFAATYFFAVTAYDTIGLESTFSDEVSYTVPTSAPPTLSLQLLPGQLAVLTGSGVPGYTYEVLSSPDLRNWSTAGSVVAGPAGTLGLTIPALDSSAVAFFRLRQLLP